MRAAILLECEGCGARWCWPPFQGEDDAVNVAKMAAMIGQPGGCPKCDRRAARYAVWGGGLEQQREIAEGARMLNGMPRTVVP